MLREESIEIEPNKSCKEWERLLDAVSAVVFFKDSKKWFVQVNRAYAEAVGLSKREGIGKSVGDFIPDPEVVARILSYEEMPQVAA
jgi:PAS domain S-box-containing protein